MSAVTAPRPGQLDLLADAENDYDLDARRERREAKRQASRTANRIARLQRSQGAGPAAVSRRRGRTAATGAHAAVIPSSAERRRPDDRPRPRHRSRDPLRRLRDPGRGARHADRATRPGGLGSRSPAGRRPAPLPELPEGTLAVSPEKLLTAKEVAEMLGMGKDWLYGEVRAGRIPHVRLGRYVRFRRETLQRWLAEIERGMEPPGTRGVR